MLTEKELKLKLLLKDSTIEKVLKDCVARNDKTNFLEFIDLIGEKNLLQEIDGIRDIEVLVYLVNTCNSVVMLDKVVNIIIKTENPGDMIKFAQNVPNTSLDKIVDAIIEVGDVYDRIRFAQNVPNAPIDKIADTIIEMGDPYYIFKFAMNVPNASINKLMIAMIATESPYYTWLFFNQIEGYSLELAINTLSKAQNLLVNKNIKILLRELKEKYLIERIKQGKIVRLGFEMVENGFDKKFIFNSLVDSYKKTPTLTVQNVLRVYYDFLENEEPMDSKSSVLVTHKLDLEPQSLLLSQTPKNQDKEQEKKYEMSLPKDV